MCPALFDCALDAHACSFSCHDFSGFHFNGFRHTLGRALVGRPHRAVLRAVPRRARRVDGRRRAAVHPRQPSSIPLVTAVDRQRLRPRLRRAASARRTRGRPARAAPGLPDRTRRVRRGIAARRPRLRSLAAHCGPLHQGRERRIHRSGRSVDHHDDVRRGAGAQPGPGVLHRLRRKRILDGSRAVRPAHRGRLALDVPAARTRRRRRPDRRFAGRAARRARCA